MRDYPRLEAFYVDNKGLCYIDLEYNYLGIIRHGSSQAEMQLIFSDEKREKKHLFCDLLHVNNECYAIPLTASSMYRINIDEHLCQKISFNHNCYRASSNNKYTTMFMSAHVYNQSIYMFPAEFPAITEYNIKTHEITYYSEWVDSVSNIGRVEENAFFRKTMLLTNVVYAPLCKVNKVLKFYLDSKSWELIDVEDGDEGYSSICFDGRYFWLSARRGNYVIRWDEQKSETKRIKGIWDDDVKLAQIEYFNNKIWVVPKTSGMIGWINGDCIEKSFIDKEIDGLKVSQGKLYTSLKNGELYIISDGESHNIVQMQSNKMKIEYYLFCMMNNYYHAGELENYLSEDDNASLEMFIQGLLQKHK